MYFYLFFYYLINLSVPVLPLLLLLLLLLLFLLFKCFGNSVPYIHANKAIEKIENWVLWGERESERVKERDREEREGREREG